MEGKCILLEMDACTAVANSVTLKNSVVPTALLVLSG